ncbi:MAG: LytR C-terminal domain-containing protein [Acidimicrobiia bacterium]|nr:LytR C-terminal domain-containing protein [Acidimicrobiia bacterium]
MERIERHDVLNAAMLSFIILGMTLTMLWGARGILDAATGDDDGETVDILANQADDSSSGDANAASESTTTTTTPPSTTSTEPTTTTTSAPTTTEAVVHPPNEVITRVGNGAAKGGVAGAGTNILVSAGYAALSPKNAETIDVSTVYYLPGYSKDADLVAQLLSVDSSNIFPMPQNPGMPVGEAHVIAVLGRDTPHGG